MHLHYVRTHPLSEKHRQKWRCRSQVFPSELFLQCAFHVEDFGVKKDKITDAKQAAEIQKDLDDAIKSVVSQFPEICDYNLIQIPKIL